MSGNKVMFMFSGQGSQYYQMGRQLYEHNPDFRRHMNRMDLIVRDLAKHSVVETLYERGHAKSELFDRTLLSHPAIFMVEFALAQSLIAVGVIPDAVLGASLGTFAAAAIVGCIDMEDALTAVVRQAVMLEECCEAGAMFAVLAEPRVFEEATMGRYSELAGIYGDTHFVVAAPNHLTHNVERVLRERRLTYQRLPVSFAFHSKWIEKVSAPYQAHLQLLKMRSANLPMACCVTSSLLSILPSNYFWRVARDSIQFRQLILYLEKLDGYRYIDIGPSGTLATLVRYSLAANSPSKTEFVISPFGNEVERIAKVAALPGMVSPQSAG